MARFGFCGASYQSQSLTADAQKCLNWYLESIESEAGKSRFALYPTPGLILFATLAGASVRALSNVNGRCFAVSGTILYEVLSNGTFNNLGTVINDNQPASMAFSTQQLLVASGGTCYVFNLNTSTFTTIPGATFTGPIIQVGYSDGFFLALVANSNRVYASAVLDATTWPGASVTLVSVFPDNVVSMLVDHREMWLFGASKTVVYYDSGNSPFPFDVVNGGFIEQGCLAPFSSARLDNSLFWLGKSEHGAAIVWRANGYSPQRVSNHAIEFAIQGYAVITDAIAYTYQDQGHAFYVLRFPSANHTWVYDVATSQWHERAYLNPLNGVFDSHHSQNHAYVFGKHLVGDWSSGKIYQMSITFLDDAGSPISRIRRAPHVSQEMEWTFHHQLMLDMETGLTSIADQTPTFFFLADSNAVVWGVSLSSIGVLQTTALGGAPSAFYLNDSLGNTWQVTVTTLGVLQTTSVPTRTAPTQFRMTSTGPATGYYLQVTTLGVLQTVPGPLLYRGAQVNLRWSDDGGHTWSNQYARDAGAQGNYKTRVIWRRLGRSRDRVYEVQCSDPAPYRLIDAYLMASPGFVPTQRLLEKIRQSA